ncbi:MAG: hypothetical protein H0T47_23960 [Planctomycetaceae bacterium]|nr:hypothetical protein [Planctomycetaceae bacterium]
MFVVAGSLAGAEARGAFLPPDLESAFDPPAGSASQEEVPRDTPQPARLEVATFFTSSIAGLGTSVVSLSIAGQILSLPPAEGAECPAAMSRLQVATERVRPWPGFVPEILRPPKV